MTTNQQAPYPGFQPYVHPYAPPPQTGPYPQQAPPSYPQQVAGYPQQPAGYPQQPAGYPQQPAGYPQQPAGYLQQPAAGFPQHAAGFPVTPPPPYPDSQNMGFVNAPYGPGMPQQSSQAFPDVPLQSETVSEEGKELTGNWTGFSSKAIRQAFIRKVYAILMVQLTFTLGVIALFIFVDKVKFFVMTNRIVYVISYVTFLAVYISLVCCGNLRRKWPANIILLSIFTMTMSYMLGTISCYHDTVIVIMAVGICAACCLAVSVFSFFTKFDFTTCGGVLCILVWVLFLFGIIAVITFRYVPILRTVYASCGALLFMLFLAYDTQQVMGGKKYELSAEEHIFAALSLYIDVVYIFLFILMLSGSKK